jgi:diadenosine tetraphosphate (Ap4A) HIT family hydrolase
MSAADCRICALVSQARPDIVHADDLWHASLLPGREVPGWLVLCLRRHAEEATGMNPAEAATFGPLVARLSEALKAATAAERVYLMAFGEEFPHWHVLLAARPADLPLEHRRASFFNNAHRYRDVESAVATAQRTREILLSTAVSAPAGQHR